MLNLDKNFWSNRYTEKSTGWDLGTVSPPLKMYFDQLTDKSIHILIPGAGNAHEAEYLHNQGFTNVYVADISSLPLDNLKKRCPTFPEKHLLCTDFFEISASFNLIVEQTFFCALNPNLRAMYFQKVHAMLKKDGKIAGVLFSTPLNTDQPPFGGSKEEYLQYFAASFEILHYEKCHNSIVPRADRELFFCLKKKSL